MDAECDFAGKEIASQYDVGAVCRCEVHPHGLINTTYRIETDQGTFALTAFLQRKEEEIKARAQVLMRLKNVPVAQPLLSRNGDRVIDLNGRPAWLAPWIEGRSFVDRHHHQKLPMSARQHQEVIRGFDGLHQELSQIALQETDLLSFLARDTEEETTIPPGRAIRSLIDQCRECYQAVTSPPPDPQTLVHRDFERQNLLFRGDTLSAVLDFDALGIGSVQQEWAHATFNHACCDPGQSAEHLAMYVEHAPLGNARKMPRNQFLAAMARFCEEDVNGFLWIAQRSPIDLNALVSHYAKALTFASRHLS